MNPIRLLLATLATVLGVAVLAAALVAEQAKRGDAKADWTIADKKYQEGNYKEAYEGFRKLALDAKAAPHRATHHLTMGVASLMSLGRADEIDEFREAVIRVQRKNWRLLAAAAESYMNVDHSGFIVAGKFYRGPHRGGGKAVNSFERDRVRSLQLVAEAMPLASKDPKKDDVAGFYLQFAQLLLSNRVAVSDRPGNAARL
jgi:hypothetical protein